LYAWFETFGTLGRVGVEGTGAYGAGLARYLRGRELEVIEVDRPNRQLRRRAGKSDTIDAIEAARAALSRRASGIAKTADGNVEAIRVLLIAKRSARDTRIKCLNQIRHLGFTGPDELRERLRDVPRQRLARTAAALRPTVGSDPVMYATKLALSTLGRRVVDLDTTTQRLDAKLDQLVRATAPDLVAVAGVGIDTAAILLVAAGDNPERIRSEAAFAHLCGVAPIEASSGKTIRHRLNRGGNRQANHALWPRVHPHEHRRTYPRLRRAATRTRTIETRDHAHPQALRRPRDLQAPHTRLTTSLGGGPGPITA
jgi:transposase